MINLAILTHNRADMVLRRVHLYKSEYNVHVFDSFSKSNIKNSMPENVKYYQNQAKCGVENLLFAASKLNSPTIFLHDDDFLSVSAGEFLEIAEGLNIVISPKYELESRLSDIQDVLDLYFLDERNNCPLLSGIYLKNPSMLDIKLTSFKCGKYKDVELIAKLILDFNAVVSEKSFIEYIEHSSNDNNVRNIDDRIALSDFVYNLTNKNKPLFRELVLGFNFARIHKVLFALTVASERKTVFQKLLRKAVMRVS